MKCIESIYDACINGCISEMEELYSFDEKSSDIASKIEKFLKDENISHEKSEEFISLMCQMSLHKESRGFCFGFIFGSRIMTEILCSK